MTQYNLLYFLYGIAIMFHFMMAYALTMRQKSRVKKLFGILLLIEGLEYVKDLPFLGTSIYEDTLFSHVLSCCDTDIVPIYVLVLVEICRPGWLTKRRVAALVIPFLILTTLFMAFLSEYIFYASLGLSAIYIISASLWAIHEIPIYHRRLREEFSYVGNVNLHWLYAVIGMFAIIMILWIYSNVANSINGDSIYIMCSVTAWAITCYFISRHEFVLCELRDNHDTAYSMSDLDEGTSMGMTGPEQPPTDEDSQTGTEEHIQELADVAINKRFYILEQRLHKMFDEDRIYLNPCLRLSELAAQLGTNRTYLSHYFNQRRDTTFYDYVNTYRIAHAKQLLVSTEHTLDTIAAASGFNSIATFRRAFQQQVGCSATAYRQEQKITS